jgi:olfactory receptor
VHLSSGVTQKPHSTARASVMYSVVTPMLNAFLYHLRIKDIKGALKRLFDIKIIKVSLFLSQKNYM